MATCNGFKNWRPARNQTKYPLAGATPHESEEEWILGLTLRDLRHLRRLDNEPQGLSEEELLEWIQSQEDADFQHDETFFSHCNCAKVEALQQLIAKERLLLSKTDAPKLRTQKSLKSHSQQKQEEKEQENVL